MWFIHLEVRETSTFSMNEDRVLASSTKLQKNMFLESYPNKLLVMFHLLKIVFCNNFFYGFLGIFMYSTKLLLMIKYTSFCVFFYFLK